MRALLTSGLIAVGALIALVHAQADVAPVNDRPNPFVTENRWAPLQPPRVWGAISAVDIDRDGRSIWVAERCGANSCATSDLAPIMKLDATGRVIASFGAGIFSVPHGIHVSHDGTIWMTDDSATPVAGKGHQVLQFDSSGKLLRRIGTAGVTGIGPDAFNRPSDVLIAPNGDIFVADGHGGDSNARIVKFAADGRFIKTWGRKGSARGEFDTPHSLAMDSRGRLFVADLRNFRIQIFDQDGNFIDEWKQFGMPGGLFIDRNDTIYVADSLSNSEVHPGWIRGIRIGSARDGTVMAFIADPTPEANPITAAEGVAADVAGNVYGAVVPTMQLQRHSKKR